MMLHQGMRVTIWGWGRHGGGAAAAAFCAKAGCAVTILDREMPDAFGFEDPPYPWACGDGSSTAITAADLIVASPAIPPRAFPAAHPPVTCPEALFFAGHRGRRIAITGTKGKSTTTAIAAALTGWTAAGNGWTPLPACDPQQDLVCELSSFQLRYIAGSPAPLAAPRFAAGIITLLGRDHLDWHPDLADYHAAKLALPAWCAAFAAGPGVPTASTAPGVRIDAGRFVCDHGVIAPVEALALRGAHNQANACLALSVALAVGVRPDALATGLQRVRALPHRLQTVHRAGGIDYIDDSIATTPEAAIAALAAVDGPLAIILGGSDKGADFTALARTVAKRGALPLVIGATAPRIQAALHAAGIAATACPDLPAAIAAARTWLSNGGSVLLSPACASFDMFRGFEDRGQRFAAAARSLASDGG